MKETFGILAVSCAMFFVVMMLLLRVNAAARRNQQLPLEELVKGYAEYTRNVFILKLDGAAFLIFFLLYLMS